MMVKPCESQPEPTPSPHAPHLPRPAEAQSSGAPLPPPPLHVLLTLQTLARRPRLTPLALAAASLLSMNAAWACDNATPGTGATVTCSDTSGGSVAQLGSTGVTINVTNTGNVSSTRTGPNTATLEVDFASTITNAGTVSISGTAATGRGAAILGLDDHNTLINTATGTITTTGANNDGMALNSNDGTITNNGLISTTGANSYGITAAWGQASGLGLRNTIVNTGTITSTGNGGRAISVVGGQSTVTNSGTLITTGGTASNRSFTVFMQGNNINFTNSGYIEADGIQSDAVVSNTANGFTASLTNQAGGTIVSKQGYGVRTVNGTVTITNAGLIESDVGTAIYMNPAAKTNVLVLQTGSTIVGTADGGAPAVSRVILQGSGTADNAFTRFGGLFMQGDNWTFSGSGNFEAALFQKGIFNLTSAIGATNANVSSGATLTGTGTLTGALTNAGTVHPGDGAGNGALTVAGSYTGSSGTLAIDSVLGDDSSRVAPLVVSSGTIGGTSTINVNNLGGLGALTTASGIPMVQATNGATSSASAFSLGGTVSAGAYTYMLFKGGTTAGSENSWFLRSSVPAPVVVTTTDPVTGAAVTETLDPVPAPGTPAIVTLAPGDDPLPIYRAAVPEYSAMPEIGRTLGWAQMATFHQRQGQQGLLDEGGALPAGWSRVWGQTQQLRAKGDANPEFNGNIGGVQLGHDLFAVHRDSGHADHFGVILGWTRAQGDVQGVALGERDAQVGSTSLDSYSAGLYWTHLLPSQAYIDAVLLGSSLQYQTKVSSGPSISTSGKAIAASLETGWPIPLTDTLRLEPQAQVVYQHQRIKDFDDGISTVAFNNMNSWLARVGLRLEDNWDNERGVLRPYLLFNLLHTFGNEGRVVFAGTTPIVTAANSTAAQFGIGIAGRFNQTMSVYASLAWLTQLDDTRQQAVTATLGVRWRW